MDDGHSTVISIVEIITLSTFPSGGHDEGQMQAAVSPIKPSEEVIMTVMRSGINAHKMLMKRYHGAEFTRNKFHLRKRFSLSKHTAGAFNFIHHTLQFNALR